MSTLRVTNLKGGSAGSAPNLPDGAVITGVATVGVLSATTFYGSGANLTGIDATALKDSGGTVKVQANSDGAVVTGVLTATTGSFTGNISVGGTLTYEDVTNVDSVGMVTARTGIKVLAGGINAVGVVTGTSFSGSGANLTGIDAAPQVKLNASGTIAAGKPTIVNTDGTISQVTEIVAGIQDPIASDSFNFFGNQINFPTAVYAASLDRIIVAQMEGNTSGASHVEAFSIGDNGSLNAHGISGTQYSGSDQYSNYSITWDSTNSKFVLCYTDQSDGNKYKARVGSLGGSNNVTITLGSAVDTGLTARNGYNSGGRECDVVYDSSNGKIVVATANSSNNAIAVVGTVSGTSTTWGSPVTILTGNSDSVNLAYDVNANKIVAIVERNTNDYIYSYVGTVSGNSISWGTYQVVEATQVAAPPSIVYMTEQQKVFVAYDQDGFRAHCKIGTVSGNSITWGARTDCGTNDTTLQRAGAMIHCAYDTFAKLPAVAWRAAYSGDVLAVSAAKSISGTTATFGNIIIAESQNVASAFVCDLNKPGGVGVFYRNVSQSGQAKYRSVKIANVSTNVTSENFLGLSAGNYTNGQEATIKVTGNNDANQVGLTTGQTYYVQNNGTISTSLASPCVVAGTAVSQTKLVINATPIAAPAWEVYQTNELNGSQGYIDSTGWTHVGYSRYKVVYDSVYCSSAWKPYWRIFKGDNTGETGTLLTASSYGSGGGYQRVQNTMNQLQRTGRNNSPFGKSGWNYTFTWFSGEMNFPMSTGKCNNTRKTSWYGTCFRGYEHIYTADAGFFNGEENKFLTGMRMIFSTNDAGDTVNPTEGRVTILRLRVS